MWEGEFYCCAQVLGVRVALSQNIFFRDGHNRFLEADYPPASAKGHNQLVITEVVVMLVSTKQRKNKIQPTGLVQAWRSATARPPAVHQGRPRKFAA